MKAYKKLKYYRAPIRAERHGHDIIYKTDGKRVWYYDIRDKRWEVCSGDYEDSWENEMLKEMEPITDKKELFIISL